MSTHELIEGGHGHMKSAATKAITIALLLFAGSAYAQTATRVTPCSATTPNNALCLSWTQDGKDTNGNAITGITYRLTQKLGSGTTTTVANNITALQYYATGLAPGSYTFIVYANCATCTAESNGSNAATGSATAIPVIPNAPVIIIAATIRADGPPTYRIIQSVTLKPNEVVFAAPAAMRPLFASR